MFRRSSEYFRGRTSVAVVNEARGMPLKVLCLLLAAFFAIFGIRDLFFCSQPLTSDPKEAFFLSVFKDCKTDILQEGFSGMVGVGHLIHSAIRFHAATTVHTADLFKSMLLLVFIDSMHVFLIIRSGLEVVPPLYAGLVILGLMYEGYALYIAHKAYKSRLKLKVK